MSFPKLWQTDQFVAGFFTDLLYFLQNMKFVRTSSSVRWKDFLCSPWKSTLSLLCGHVAGSSQEFTMSLWPQQPSWRRQGGGKERRMGLAIPKEANVMTAAKKPLLSRKNIRDRLIFCNRYRDWTAEVWGKVIFSDESPFRLFGASGKKLVRRRQGERYHQSCKIPSKTGGKRLPKYDPQSETTIDSCLWLGTIPGQRRHTIP